MNKYKAVYKIKSVDEQGNDYVYESGFSGASDVILHHNPNLILVYWDNVPMPLIIPIQNIVGEFHPVKDE